MKKIIIGRNNACDIIIPDTSDLVSRKQAVLTYSFWGKMTIYDTSNNGTYVNGQKLENGKGVPVTRKDKVNFARIADLDWNEVKDPYHKTKLLAAAGTVLLAVAAVLLTLWLSRPASSEEAVPPVNTETTEEKGETATTVQPQTVDETPQQPAPKKQRRKRNAGKKQSTTPKELINKEVNEKAPIVY